MWIDFTWCFYSDGQPADRFPTAGSNPRITKIRPVSMGFSPVTTSYHPAVKISRYMRLANPRLATSAVD
jgi:hypothetical protein